MIKMTVNVGGWEIDSQTSRSKQAGNMVVLKHMFKTDHKNVDMVRRMVS